MNWVRRLESQRTPRAPVRVTQRRGGGYSTAAFFKQNEEESCTARPPKSCTRNRFL
jgi:hypothetical protein